ncbi:hypothetical protein Pint_25174 [Pistacia integerrima]|uniref:Uncharacterized protein n=1 Tax=Pistacia integerrima TaxID=434235 RepID=A0ACC0YF11_9ROSI|nr:hypothetical protein Pint_25174 [Pistacia integerrima]
MWALPAQVRILPLTLFGNTFLLFNPLISSYKYDIKLMHEI